MTSETWIDECRENKEQNADEDQSSNFAQWTQLSGQSNKMSHVPFIVMLQPWDQSQWLAITL